MLSALLLLRPTRLFDRRIWSDVVPLHSMQESAPPCADQLPLSYGVRPPAEPTARCAAVQAQVAAALEALEQQRQLKLQLAAAEGVPEAERRLLEAEAAADLQAQALLAHWGTQAACEARAQQQGCA